MTERLFLYADLKRESKLAIKYLKDESLQFLRVDRNFVDEGLDYVKSPPPFLLVQSQEIFPQRYSSLMRIKEFLKLKRLEAFGLNREKQFDYWHQKVNGFSCFYNFNNDGTKIVKCFDERNKEIFIGDLTKSPFPLKSLLDEHRYKNWDQVSGWKIGSYDNLMENIDDKGKVINADTRTVLFPDDMENLRLGKKVITHDSGCAYQVIYEAYFNDNGDIYGIYANMID